jgi:hypothetical protein
MDQSVVVVWRWADLLNKYPLHQGVLNKKYCVEHIDYMINMPPSGLEPLFGPRVPVRGERAHELKTCLIGRSCVPKGILYIRIIER